MATLVALAWRVYSTHTFTPEPIPEPTSMLLFGTGLAALGRIGSAAECRVPVSVECEEQKSRVNGLTRLAMRISRER